VVTSLVIPKDLGANGNKSVHTLDLRALIRAERRGWVGQPSWEGVVVRVDGAADGPEAIPAGATGAGQSVLVAVPSEPVEPRCGLHRQH